MKKTLLVMAACCTLNAKAQMKNPTSESGKTIFQNHCVRCHGYDGQLGKLGAKNLKKSKLNDEKLFHIISHGKWIMPRWKKVLTPEQISSVIVYIKTLRTNQSL